MKSTFQLFKDAFWQWYGDNTFQLGAALAYYTVFSIAPIILIAISLANVIFGWFFGSELAQDEIVNQISEAVGPRVGQAIGDLLQYNQETPQAGTIATVISVVVLLVGATTVFAQLQQALNTIWGVQPKPGRGVMGAVMDRLWSFAIVLVIGFLLLVSLVASTALTLVTNATGVNSIPYVGMVLSSLLSLGIFTLLFAAIYKVLPDVEIAWSDVWVGAFVTALLFTVGKFLIGLYLGQSSWINAYGAAGSLIVILLWVYYSSQILLFGAEFTQVYANSSGKPMRPEENAEPVTEEARARQGLPRQSPLSRQPGGNGDARVEREEHAS